jgi:hypothetical protein
LDAADAASLRVRRIVAVDNGHGETKFSCAVDCIGGFLSDQRLRAALLERTLQIPHEPLGPRVGDQDHMSGQGITHGDERRLAGSEHNGGRKRWNASVAASVGRHKHPKIDILPVSVTRTRSFRWRILLCWPS